VELNLEKIAALTGGRILNGPPSLSFRAFSIDSRNIRPGDLFFAIIDRRDGHDFLADALEKGAAGAVVSRDIRPLKEGVGLIRVEDTLRALQDLAGKVISSLPVRIVGITGSIGKTTVKEFTALLLSSRLSVLKSEGNYNNHLGLPLSVLRLEPGHEVAVLEMGMSAPGEILRLTRIAPPDVAVITNIRPVHTAYFSSLQEIARAKKEILEGTKPGGTAVVNGDDPLARKIAADWQGEKILFGKSGDCTVQALSVKREGTEGISLDFSYGGSRRKVRLPFLYTGFLYDFLAASSVAFAFSLPVDEVTDRAADLHPLPMRGEVFALENDILLVDDSYNSNPAALEGALRDLSTLGARRKVAVLGDMLELGDEEETYHEQAGRQAWENGWDILVTVGPLGRSIGRGAVSAGMDPECIFSFPDADRASEHIKEIVKRGDLVLVKGSRGMQTEKIAARLKGNA